jgi:hypothetical protein
VHSLHDQVHALGGEILQAHALHDTQAVQAGLQELHVLRDALLAALDRLMQ